MEPRLDFRTLDRHACSRRDLFRTFAGLGLMGAAGSAALGSPSRASAQVPTGEIVVDFESRGGAMEAAVTAAINTLATANPDLKITIAEPSGSSYSTKLVMALQQGKGPDVFLFTSLTMAEFASAGFVTPLDSYLATWPDTLQFLPVAAANIRYNDQVWGLPYLMDTHFLYYRKDLFEAAGLPREWQPATLDDIVAAGVALKAAKPDLIPYVLFAGANPGNSTAMRGFMPMVIANGGSLKDEAGKWIIDSCAIRRAMEFYERVYRTDQIVPEEVISTVNATKAMREAFGMGKVGMMFEGCWAWDDWTGADPSLADTIGYVLHPHADGSAPFTLGGFGNAWYMSAKTAYPDLAWALIAAMNSREVQIALNLDDLHVPTRGDAANDPAFLTAPFNQAMVSSMDSAVIMPPDPSIRQLVGVIQDATGLVATGDANPGGAVEKYGSELTRILGADNVVSQPCQ